MNFDIREYAYRVLELAKENLQRDGVLLPVAFVIAGDEITLVQLSFQDHDQKEREYHNLVEQARASGAMALITLNDAYYSNRKHDFREYTEGYYPGRLQAESAPECIVLTVSGPAVPTWEVTVPYERQPEGIVFGQAEERNGTDLNFLQGWASDPSVC